MEKKKLNLKTLEVQSFITKIDDKAITVVGGDVGSLTCGGGAYCVSDQLCQGPTIRAHECETVGCGQRLYPTNVKTCQNMGCEGMPYQAHTYIPPYCPWSGFDNC